MRAVITKREYEQLSAYVDGQLSAREKNRLEERIGKLPELQSALLDIKQIKSLLGTVPHRHAPRNFTLTPAMVAEIEAQQKRPGRRDLFPVFSFTSALATIALVASFVIQLLPGSQSLWSANTIAKEELAQQPTMQVEMAPEEPPITGITGATQEAGILEALPSMKLEQPQQGVSDTRQPPVIMWNNPNNNVETYSMGGESAALPGEKGLGGGSGMSGSAEPLPEGAIIVPLEGVASLQPTAVAAQPAAPTVESNAKKLEGESPILGIPPADQGGKITNQKALDVISDINQAPTAEPESSRFTSPVRLVSIGMVQAMLALIAVLAGMGAFYFRRR
jgi:hypothetical protein